MYRVLVFNIAVNQQQAEITQITPEPLSATPTLQKTHNKMMSKMIQMEHTMSKMQANVPVPNLQYFQLPNLPSNPVVPPEAEAIPNSVHFEQDQIPLHPRELLSEHVRDLDNQENFDPSSCQIVTELNWDSDSLVSLSHQSKKRSPVEDNVLEGGNLQLHEKIIDTIIRKRQSIQNSGPGIISKLTVGIKKVWTEGFSERGFFKGYKDQLAVPENSSPQ